MEKRVLLAVFLSFLVLFAYQRFLLPPPRKTPVPQQSGGALPGSAQSPGQGAPAASAVPGARSGAATASPPASEPEPLDADLNVRDIIVESDAVRAVFDTRGAVLKSWRLKRFLSEKGEALDLVPAALVPNVPRPFSLTVEDPAVSRRLQQARYKPSADVLRLSGGGSQSLALEYRDSGGLAVRKVFSFDPAQPYLITFSATVQSGDQTLNPTVHWGAGLGDTYAAATSSTYQKPQAIYFRDGDVSRVDAGDIPQLPVQEGTFGFAGIDDHYFLAAAVPAGKPLRVEYAPIPITISADGEEKPLSLVSFDTRFQGPPAGARFFIGPKDFDVLAAIDRDLVRAIHFGIFSWLVVPLLRALKWINTSVGNFGWSIVILTILINAAMFPLRHKSVVSMRKMQELQPEVKVIQDRYANLKTTDPARQKMNVELMNLYRERGVNPASGCVPMLLTMPVLFAFYALLSVAIEIRGAPFMGWIKDLSLHDPLYVTPVLMGATMLWQQTMTPSTADPMQQKMMLMMPVVFTFMFLWAPSGLVLYWLVSNLWAIGQQKITNKIIGPPNVRTVRPPAERRVKKVGSGRTEQATKERS
ncbi:MAG: membrane protein insertase YidC [Acidobacteria bacterium]|nr:membrane protein insertase YidC [Acidobacteriota bacterium]